MKKNIFTAVSCSTTRWWMLSISLLVLGTGRKSLVSRQHGCHPPSATSIDTARILLVIGSEGLRDHQLFGECVCVNKHMSRSRDIERDFDLDILFYYMSMISLFLGINQHPWVFPGPKRWMTRAEKCSRGPWTQTEYYSSWHCHTHRGGKARNYKWAQNLHERHLLGIHSTKTSTNICQVKMEILGILGSDKKSTASTVVTTKLRGNTSLTLSISQNVSTLQGGIGGVSLDFHCGRNAYSKGPRWSAFEVSNSLAVYHESCWHPSSNFVGPFLFTVFVSMLFFFFFTSWS